MINIIFNYKNTETTIQCQEDEKLEDACKKFVSKMNINLDDLIYICNGEQLNLNKKVKEINKIILVYNKKLTEIKNEDRIIKSKDIICPECGEICIIKINNFNVKLYECKNNHEFIMSFNEFDNSQKINESKIICNVCNKNNKSKTFNNQFFICGICNANLCPLCKSLHDTEHELINYDNKNYICNKHNENFISFCEECKINLCYQCEIEHENSHKTIYFKGIMPDIKNIKNKMNELKDKINIFINYIDDNIAKLNEIKYNIQKYYEINYNILNNFNIKKRNYQTLKNLNNMNINNIINNLNKIINDNDINNILNINKNNFENEEEINKGNIITLKYKINKNEEKIQVLNNFFVENNKKNFKIFYEGKKYELTEFFNIKNDDNKSILDLKLIQINNDIKNISYMFSGCSSLLSLSGIEDLDISNVSFMESIFWGCSLLSSLSDISKWDPF